MNFNRGLVKRSAHKTWPVPLYILICWDEVQEEGVNERRLFVLAKTSRCSPVACLHVGLEQKKVVVGFEGAKLRDILCGFPVLHL